MHTEPDGSYALYVNASLPGQRSEPYDHGVAWAIVAAIAIPLLQVRQIVRAEKYYLARRPLFVLPVAARAGGAEGPVAKQIARPDMMRATVLLRWPFCCLSALSKPSIKLISLKTQRCGLNPRERTQFFPQPCFRPACE